MTVSLTQVDRKRAAAWLLLSGCISTVPKEDYINRNILPRAAFDLSCAEKDLKVVPLAPTSDKWIGFEDGKLEYVPGMADSMGVSGCGKKAVYVATPNRSWVLNSDSQPADKVAPR